MHMYTHQWAKIASKRDCTFFFFWSCSICLGSAEYTPGQWTRIISIRKIKAINFFLAHTSLTKHVGLASKPSSLEKPGSNPCKQPLQNSRFHRILSLFVATQFYASLWLLYADLASSYQNPVEFSHCLILGPLHEINVHPLSALHIDCLQLQKGA